MTALHELYLAVKQEVEAAVAAVNAATEAAAQLVHQAIQDALAAVEALDDYLDYFGWVGSPIDAAVEELLEQLYNLAKVLDSYGYYATYQKTFGAANQYSSAKQSYDDFTGGLGGQSSGAGASGSWSDNFPWFTCFNRNNATLQEPGAGVAPSETSIDYAIILGPCSEVFVYEEGCDFWEAGIYQYARLHAWIRFHDLDVIFTSDYGATPAHTSPSFGYKQIINNRTTIFDVQHSQSRADWFPAGPIVSWPYDTHWEAILTESGEQYRDLQMKVIGRYEDSGHNYWLYNLAYWMAIQQAGFYDGSGQPVATSCPEQLRWTNPCSDTPAPGPDVKPIIPWLPYVTNPRMFNFLAHSLRLRAGVLWLPYDLCFEGQKLLWEGQQLTFGDV